MMFYCFTYSIGNFLTEFTNSPHPKPYDRHFFHSFHLSICYIAQYAITVIVLDNYWSIDF